MLNGDPTTLGKVPEPIQAIVSIDAIAGPPMVTTAQPGVSRFTPGNSQA